MRSASSENSEACRSSGYHCAPGRSNSSGEGASPTTNMWPSACAARARRQSLGFWMMVVTTIALIDSAMIDARENRVHHALPTEIFDGEFLCALAHVGESRWISESFNDFGGDGIRRRRVRDESMLSGSGQFGNCVHVQTKDRHAARH